MFENTPFLAVVLFIILYLLPSIAARGHPRFARILIVNLFLGWTVIGWILAMFWALSRVDETDILEKIKDEERKYTRLRQAAKTVRKTPVKKHKKHRKKHHKHHKKPKPKPAPKPKAKPKPQTKLTTFVTKAAAPVKKAVIRKKSDIEYKGTEVYAPEHELIASAKIEEKETPEPKPKKIRAKKQVLKSAQKFCSKCGHPLLISDKYCDRCGAKSHLQ